MKKIILFLLIFIVLLNLAGCFDPEMFKTQTTYTVTTTTTQDNTTTQNYTTSQQNIDNTSEEIILTTDNIYDYLSISTLEKNIKIEDCSQMNSGLPCETGSCDVIIETTPLKRGDFKDVTLTISIKPQNDDWRILEEKIILPYDGKYENIFNGVGVDSYMSEHPCYEAQIISISGTFKKQ